MKKKLRKKYVNSLTGDYVLGGNGNFKTSFYKNNEKNIIGEFKGVGFQDR